MAAIAIKLWDFDRLMTMSYKWIQQYLITYPEQRYLCEGYLPDNQKAIDQERRDESRLYGNFQVEGGDVKQFSQGAIEERRD